jgi:hypothetical protein
LRHIFEAARREGVADRAQVAFMLGVAAHETNRFDTLTEYASGDGYEGMPEFMNDVVGDGAKYKGRGFVQLTGKLRYFYYTAIKPLYFDGWKADLYTNPYLASNPRIAAAILVDYLKYGQISTKADWVYANTNSRPDGKYFSGSEMKGSFQSISTYKFLSQGTASMSSSSLFTSTASNEKFAQTASIVNRYEGEKLTEVTSFSMKFFQALQPIDSASGG